jgi:hypothetical protein
MAGLRSYSPDVEGLATAWRRRCETEDDEWKETSKAGDAGGEASGYFVTSGTVNGYAKPSKIDAAYPRIGAGNLIVSKDAADPTKPLRVAYIDYSNSMFCEWRGRPFTDIPPRPIYPTDQKDADAKVLEDMLKRIEALGQDTIKGIVDRIPDDFAPLPARSQILDGLLHRQSRVRPALKAVYGGIA